MSVVGLDLGTSQVKAIRFDATWSVADSATRPTEVLRASGGRREQDMDQVWAQATRVLREVVERTTDDIELVALTAQGDGCWLVDAHGRPAGPALLWNDNRAGELVADWRAAGVLDEAFRISGNYGAPGLAHAQLRWLLANDPERVPAGGRLLSCGSWVYARLTGRQVLDVSEAANPFCDARTRRYSDRLLELVGLEAHRDLLPEIVEGPDRVAALLPDAAEAVGLPAGTPVALGPYDLPATALGLGALDVGDAFGILGTTLCVGVVADDPAVRRTPNGMTLPAVADGLWQLVYATLIGTEVLDWSARLLGTADAKQVVDLAARATRPDPPLVLPYLSSAGERSPFLDPHARGRIVGLDVGHTPADVARGVVEGLTMVVLDCLRAAGPAQTLTLAGGGARSDFWSQQIADACGVPVWRPADVDAGALGAALSGALGVGMITSLDEVAAITSGSHDSSGERGSTHQPDEARHRYYAERFDALLAERPGP